MTEEKEEYLTIEKLDATSVRIIRRKSEYFLVQWEDGVTFQRAWVPSNKFLKRVEAGDIVEVEAPWEWPPYGERWDLLFEFSQITPEILDRELKRKEIWTIEDLQTNPNIVRLVLMKIYGLDIVKMLNTAAFKQQATGGNP